MSIGAAPEFDYLRRSPFFHGAHGTPSIPDRDGPGERSKDRGASSTAGARALDALNRLVAQGAGPAAMRVHVPASAGRCHAGVRVGSAPECQCLRRSGSRTSRGRRARPRVGPNADLVARAARVGDRGGPPRRDLPARGRLPRARANQSVRALRDAKQPTGDNHEDLVHEAVGKTTRLEAARDHVSSRRA